MDDLKIANGKFAYALIQAVSSLRRHDAQNARTMKVIEVAGTKLTTLLQHVETVELAHREGQLFLGSARLRGLEGAEQVVALMQSKRIQTLSIARGADHSQFLSMLELLCGPSEGFDLARLDRLPHVSVAAITGQVRPMEVPPPPGPAKAPQLPEGYTLVGELGRGGQGAVFQVRNESADRMEACKTLTTAKPHKREAFIREIRLQSKLNHRSIAQIHFVDPNFGYYLMEYLPGGSLREKLDGDPLPDVQQVAFWIRDALHAVGYAHQNGIVHRDIKPENILFDIHGKPKVCDFGIATTVAGEKQLAGTPCYMAPEQWVNQDVDHRADIWAFGVLLFEAMTGYRPYDGESTTIIGKQVQFDALPAVDVSELGELARELVSVARGALEKDPHYRYESADDFATEIQSKLFTGVPELVSSSTGGVVVEPPQGVKTIGAVLTTLAAVVILLVIAFSFGRGTAEIGLTDAQALAQLRATVQDDTLTLEERIDACARWLSNRPSATDDQQDEVRLMRTRLNSARKEVKAARVRLAALPARIDRLLEQGHPDEALRIVEAFDQSAEATLVPDRGPTIAAMMQKITDGRERAEKIAKARHDKFRQLIDHFETLCARERYGEALAGVPPIRGLVAQDLPLKRELQQRVALVEQAQGKRVAEEERKIHVALDAKDFAAADRALAALKVLGASGTIQKTQERSVRAAKIAAGHPLDGPPPAPEGDGPKLYMVQMRSGFTLRGIAKDDPTKETIEVQLRHMRLTLQRKDIQAITRVTQRAIKPDDPPTHAYRDDDLGFVLVFPDSDRWVRSTPTHLPLVALRYTNEFMNTTIDLLVEPRGKLPFVSGANWVGGMRAKISSRREYDAARKISWAVELTSWDTRELRFTLRAVTPDKHFTAMLPVFWKVRRGMQRVPRTGLGRLNKRYTAGRKALELVAIAERTGGAKGIEGYAAAVELFPRWAILRFSYSKALKVQGKLDEAIAQASVASTLEPKNITFLEHHSDYVSRRGTKMILRGKTAKGLEEHEKAYEMVKGIDTDKKFRARMAEAYFRAAKWRMDRKQYKRVMEAMHKALKLYPKKVEYRVAMSDACYAQGGWHFRRKEYGHAKAWLRKALTYYKHPGALELLRKIP